MDKFDDWASYMIWAEKNMKDLDDALLHEDYSKVDAYILSISNALQDVQNWVAKRKSTS